MSASFLVYALLVLAAALCVVATRAAWFVIRGGFVRDSVERDGKVGAALAALAGLAHASLIVAGFLLANWIAWLVILAASAALGAFVVTGRTWPFWHAFKPLIDFLAIACVALVWAVERGLVEV